MNKVIQSLKNDVMGIEQLVVDIQQEISKLKEEIVKCQARREQLVEAINVLEDNLRSK